MLLQRGQFLFCLTWLLPALAATLDLNELDKTLNPRLVGMIFNLYRPTPSANKKPPIVVDCDHPGVLCQFGSKPLVARPIGECNCGNNEQVVPVVTGLEPDKESGGATGEGGETVSPKTPGVNTDDVPIYKGMAISNMEAILASGAAEAALQYKPTEKLSNKWKPSANPEDLYQKRFGEIPKKYASYYPFSKPVLIDDPDEFDPDFDQGPPFPFFPEMFGPHHKHQHFHPFKNKQGGQGAKPASTWRQTAKPTPSTTKRPVATSPVPPSKAGDSAKKT